MNSTKNGKWRMGLGQSRKKSGGYVGHWRNGLRPPLDLKPRTLDLRLSHRPRIVILSGAKDPMHSVVHLRRGEEFSSLQRGLKLPATP